jgi:hypothetical protein
VKIAINFDMNSLFEIEDYDIHSAASTIIRQELEKTLRKAVQAQLLHNPRILEIAARLENKIVELAFTATEEKS